MSIVLLVLAIVGVSASGFIVHQEVKRTGSGWLLAAELVLFLTGVILLITYFTF